MLRIILNPQARIIAFLGMFVIILIVGVLAFQSLKSIEMPAPKLYLSMPTLEEKKIALIIAFKDFRDEEYFRPKEILKTAGAEIKTASTQTGTAVGADGGEVEVDFAMGDLKVFDFDAVVFIGGPGAVKYLDNEKSYRIAKDVVEANKVLAAICISPTILAKAGVLTGKKATVWSSPLDKSPVKILEDYGAIYQDELVVVDGKIVTGNGPAAAKKFGETIVEVLTGK